MTGAVRVAPPDSRHFVKNLQSRDCREDATELATSVDEKAAHGSRSLRKARQTIRCTKACALHFNRFVDAGTTIAGDSMVAAPMPSGTAAVCGGAVDGVVRTG